jgi:hypothetical protein
VLRAEDLFEDPAGQMARLAGFLGIDPALGRSDLRAMTVGGNREAVDPGPRAPRRLVRASGARPRRCPPNAPDRDFGRDSAGNPPP